MALSDYASRCLSNLLPIHYNNSNDDDDNDDNMNITDDINDDKRWSLTIQTMGQQSKNHRHSVLSSNNIARGRLKMAVKKKKE